MALGGVISFDRDILTADFFEMDNFLTRSREGILALAQLPGSLRQDQAIIEGRFILQIMKSIDTIKTISGPVYDLGQDSKHSCSEVTKTVDRIKTLAYPGD